MHYRAVATFLLSYRAEAMFGVAAPAIRTAVAVSFVALVAVLLIFSIVQGKKTEYLRCKL